MLISMQSFSFHGGLCGLVITVSDYRVEGLYFDPWVMGPYGPLGHEVKCASLWCMSSLRNYQTYNATPGRSIEVIALVHCTSNINRPHSHVLLFIHYSQWFLIIKPPHLLVCLSGSAE